jgi:cytochrome c peroxidase
MNSTRLAVAHRIYDAYKTEYEAVFGALDAGLATSNGRFPATGKPTQPNFDNMADPDKVIVNRILANFGKALQAYTRKLVSREAKFDAWVAGDDGAFDSHQLAGARLFVEKGCGNCHSGAHFSDHGFHKLGVPQTGSGVPATDDGRGSPKDLTALLASPMNINSDYSDKKDTGKLDGLVPGDYVGKFRTPSLRGVAESGPYMHAGQFASLEQVIDFYALGGNLDTGTGELQAFAISPQEKADLIAFLGTLSGQAIPAVLLEDHAPN